MSPTSAAHFCSCGTRLARDNRTGRCAACRTKDRERLLRPPAVPNSFWDHTEIRAALASRHVGRVVRAYRAHPFHGIRPLAQDTVARWLGVTQSQLSRIENGSGINDLDRLVAWARLLDIPEQLLWFRLPASKPAAEARLARPERPASGRGHRLPFPRLPRDLVSVGADDLAAVRSLRRADRRI